MLKQDVKFAVRAALGLWESEVCPYQQKEASTCPEEAYEMTVSLPAKCADDISRNLPDLAPQFHCVTRIIRGMRMLLMMPPML